MNNFIASVIGIGIFIFILWIVFRPMINYFKEKREAKRLEREYLEREEYKTYLLEKLSKQNEDNKKTDKNS